MSINPDPRTNARKRASEEILSRRAAIAEALVPAAYRRHPQWTQNHGDGTREEALQDADFHLSYLAEAVATESPGLFADHVGWAKVMLARRGVLPGELASKLDRLTDILPSLLGPDACEQAQPLILYARQRLPEFPDELPTFMEPGQPHALLAHQYLQVLLRGERQFASKLILDAVRRGVPVRDIYLHVFQRSQYEIGRLWQSNEISVAQEHFCTAATQLIMSQLYPYIFAGEKGEGTFVGVCVSGDLHEMGGRMIADFFEMAGWNAFYLGAHTPVDSVIETLLERRADVLGISATITYHVRAVEELIRAVRAEPACAGVKILVGGYPFNISPDLWRTIHADGTALDAGGVVALATALASPKAVLCC